MTQPTPQDIANASRRAEIADRFREEYEEALTLAESILGPGWQPAGRHFLVEKDEEERTRASGDRVRPAATVFTVSKDGAKRHFTVTGGIATECSSAEAGFGTMLHEPHPTRGFTHRGLWVPYQRYSLYWSGYEPDYQPRTAEQLAAARAKREEKAVEREAASAPLFADLIREEGYVLKRNGEAEVTGRVEQIGGCTLYLGDCLEVMATLEGGSVDAIVTDPPYGIRFMGKEWDGKDIEQTVRRKPRNETHHPDEWGRHDGAALSAGTYDLCPTANQAFQAWVREWALQCLRVLKPGGQLLAFGSPRTYHRMACGIEDAGFDIRDQIMWVFSSGFPKSHNLDNQRGDTFCNCEEMRLPCDHDKGTKPSTEYNLRSVPSSDLQAEVRTCQKSREVLQHGVPEPGAYSPEFRQESSQSSLWGAERSMEGRSYAPEAARELRAGSVHPSPGVGDADGTQGRLRDGTSVGHGKTDGPNASPRGNGSPPRSQAAEQRTDEPGTLAGQPQSQAGGAWPVCRRCLLPRIPRGLGTALKPAHEPVVVARKPLIGTVAANVRRHGTGALNIDGCRVKHVTVAGGSLALNPHLRTHISGGNGGQIIAHERDRRLVVPHAEGRWPANLIHDGSEEVRAAFPQAKGQQGAVTGQEPSSKTNNVYREFGGRPATTPRRDQDTNAARFFYCAKASRQDREEGLDGLPLRAGGMRSETSGQHLTRRDGGAGPVRNHHPTVKPTELMRYLCRLVTPPGGVVLDPFMGSGSTLKAAVHEGFRGVGIEREPEYFEIATRRAGHAGRQPDLFATSPKQEEAQQSLGLTMA